MIDDESWKAEKSSTMRALDREDLTYLAVGIDAPDSVSLAVLYDGYKSPLAFSLCVQEPHARRWFAAKWGCTVAGRVNKAGIACFVHHLERLRRTADPHGPWHIDFWGRRSIFYDAIKNRTVDRLNIDFCGLERRP